MTDHEPQSNDPTAPPAGRLIVVGVDGSTGSLEALKWAARQAELTASTLEIVIAWDWPGVYGWDIPLSPEYDPEAEARKKVQSIAAETQREHPQLTVRVRVERGYPAPILVSRSESADLLVVGSRGFGEFVGMLLGSVSEYCTAKAHCPVMIYRQSEAPS
jgi:nucleotide-binding universal stress UspA family protein